MNEDKKVNWFKLIVLLICIGLIISMGYMKYQNRGWVKKVEYSNWEFLDLESAENGYNCMLDNCKIIDSEYNTQVKECICKGNNEKVRIIATNKVEYYEYPKFEPLNYKPEEVENETII